jgi:HEAT repeat protein
MSHFRNLLGHALSTTLIAMLAAPCVAHGGQYRGPGNVTPPSGGAAGGGGASPQSPSASGTGGTSGGAAAPTPSGPGAAPAPGGVASGTSAAAPQGVQLDADLTAWTFWWEFNKDPFIKLKEAVHSSKRVVHSDSFFMGLPKRSDGSDSLRPTEAQIDALVLPALKRAMEVTSQRDITSSCMVAMAKIGRDHAEFSILDVLRARLVSRDQEIRETAALALGISQREEAVETLVQLLLDTQPGRQLVDRSEVDDRTRAFAAYGLGLIAQASTSVDLKQRVATVLGDQLRADVTSSRNVKVAVINALGLLDAEGPTDKHRIVVKDTALVLESYLDREAGPAEQMIQAHVPPAIASLLERSVDAGLRSRYVKRFVDLLRAERKPSNERPVANMTQSAALALGRLARPNDKDSADAWVSSALFEGFRDGRDHQTRYYALMALGEIGGTENRARLLEVLSQGSKALQKPWAALALGVLCHRDRVRRGAAADTDAVVGDALANEFRTLKNPDTLAALAVALGLCGHRPAADQLRAALAEHRSQDELAGYLCIGLALMDDRRAIDLIRDIVRTSERRPTLLVQIAVALGRLGDKHAADQLLGQMTTSNQNLAKMSELLHDDSLNDLSRAFAAVALGGVADKEPMPWNSKIARSVNYRASVETLTNQVNGVLDIL